MTGGDSLRGASMAGERSQLRNPSVEGTPEERERRIIELEDIGKKITFISDKMGRFVYDSESGTAEVFHFLIKECAVRQVDTIVTIITADGSEFIPGEDTDVLAEVEVLEGHRKSPH